MSLLPALWALRAAYPHAHICLASEFYPGKAFVSAPDLLEGSGLVDSFARIAITESFWRKVVNRVGLVASMAMKRWDLGIVLMSPYPPMSQGVLDTLRKLLSRFRVRRIIGPTRPVPFTTGDDGYLKRAPHVSDSLLEILRADGILVSPPQQGRFELPPFEHEAIEVEAFLQKNDLAKEGMPLVAVAISSNMPSKIWPRERFVAVLHALHAEHNVYPVFFGAGREAVEIETAIKELGNQGVAVLDKPLRFVAELLRRCNFYLGNDTGLMHMAVAIGLRCVAVFSSRSAPGVWFPYGKGHEVLRTPIPCEGCQLVECIELNTQCLKDISIKQVMSACQRILGVRG